jgi:hypothetical protein|tara:strand:+ start:966 stop:1133 length:168 start_codon:yes stop_codon:yes gene_type:complete
MAKSQTKRECIMNQNLESLLNSIVNLLSAMEVKLGSIESKLESKDKKTKKRFING